MDWRERLARVVWEYDCTGVPEDFMIHSIDPLDEGWGYLAQADAILSTIDAAGCAIVPKEATEEMLHNGEGLSDFLLPDAIGNTRERRLEEMAGAYRAMIAARPK